MRPKNTLHHLISTLAITAALSVGCNRQSDSAHSSDAAEESSVALDPGVSDRLGDDPAFEWAGVFELPAGTSDLVLQPGPDENMNIALVPLAGGDLSAAVDVAKAAGAGTPQPTAVGTTLAPGKQFYGLKVDETGEMRFPVTLPTAGKYVLFTQHFADEFQMLFDTPAGHAMAGEMMIFKNRFNQIPISDDSMKTFGVILQAAETKLIKPTITVPARVAFNTEAMADVGSPVTGRVIELKVKQGDKVKKGDALLRMESPELGEAQSHFLQRRTEVAAGKPAVALAQEGYDRAKTLFDRNGGIALSEVQRRQAELQTAVSAQQNAGAALLAAESKLRLLGMDKAAFEALATSGEIDPHFTLFAPIDGEVIRRDITLGALVNPDKEEVFVIADLSSVWVMADVAESQIGTVSVGSTVALTVPALPGEVFDGVVSYIDPQLDAATRTARVRIAVNNTNGRLRPGMFANAKISPPADVQGAQAVLAVPEAAVQNVSGQTVVFVPMRDKPGMYLKRPVTLEPAVGDFMPVRYGLKVGEPIVAASSFLLKAEYGKSGAEHGH